MSNKTERISVRITPELKQKFMDLLKMEGLNQSDIITGCIEAYVSLYSVPDIDDSGTLDDYPF